MEEMSFTMEKLRQGVYSLSEPMKQLEVDLKNKLVIYDNNPLRIRLDKRMLLML
jgi:phage terminase large subunit-like protein